MANQETNVRLEKDMMRPFIEKEGKQVADMLAEARLKYGARYNKRNGYEMMYIKFGDPRYTPDKFYDEYVLIIAKKSQLPSSVRQTVEQIMSRAANACFSEQLRKAAKEQQAAEEKAKAAEEKTKAAKAEPKPNRTRKTTKKEGKK